MWPACVYPHTLPRDSPGVLSRGPGIKCIGGADLPLHVPYTFLLPPAPELSFSLPPTGGEEERSERGSKRGIVSTMGTPKPGKMGGGTGSETLGSNSPPR